jgi:hypothetical protein
MRTRNQNQDSELQNWIAIHDEGTDYLPGMQPKLVRPFKFPSQPYEYAVKALRECPLPDAMQICDTPQRAADYWRLHVEDSPYFDPERECFVVLFLNTRRRVKGHQLLTQGTADTILTRAASKPAGRQKSNFLSVPFPKASVNQTVISAFDPNSTLSWTDPVTTPLRPRYDPVMDRPRYAKPP